MNEKTCPCAGCGRGAAQHNVDDEELRECAACGCKQYTAVDLTLDGPPGISAHQHRDNVAMGEAIAASYREPGSRR